MDNASLSGLYATLRDHDPRTLDTYVKSFESRLGNFARPQAYQVLWDLLSTVPEDDTLRYAVFKMTERLVHVSHRNHAVLCTLGLVPYLLSRYPSLPHSGSSASSPLEKFDRTPERQVVQKLLRSLLETGARTSDVCSVLHRVVRPDDTLDGDMLEIVRGAMRAQARWPAHALMENRAAFTIVSDSGVRGMPSTGFTHMVCKLSFRSFPAFAPHVFYSLLVVSCAPLLT
jgi:hypothetical protein